MSSVAKKGLMQERGREDRKGKEEHEQVRMQVLLLFSSLVVSTQRRKKCSKIRDTEYGGLWLLLPLSDSVKGSLPSCSYQPQVWPH